MKISVQLDEGAYMPERAHDTDAGADLRCRDGFILYGRSSAKVDTGVHVQLPHGTVGMLKSKSGLNVNYGVTSDGVIDEGYTGSIVAKLYNHSDTAHRFLAGDKITQLVIMPVDYSTFAQVDEIQGGERGDGGYGSTGR